MNLYINGYHGLFAIVQACLNVSSLIVYSKVNFVNLV